MNYLLTLLAVVISFSVSQNVQPVKISVPAGDIVMTAGEERSIILTVDIESPWHINSHSPNDEFLIATKVSVAGNGITLVGTSFPAPHDVAFSFSEQPVSVFEGKIDITVKLKAEKNAAEGKRPVTVKLNYQACDDQTCLAPKTVNAVVNVVVKGTGSAPPATGALTEPPKENSQPVKENDETVSQPLQTYGGAPVSEEESLASTLEQSGLAVSLVLIFLGGLALNLTPCVYPLIPITVGYFGGQSEGKTSRLFLLGVLYMLGMALTYSVIGVATSLSGALFGTLLQNVYVIIGIAALFVTLALSQFGVYEFSLPSSWMAAAGGAKGGPFGAFFMGLTMGIVAAPCIGPFVLGLVTFVAAKGDPIQGFLMFFVLAIGLGLPYLILALFSGKIKNLPRSGEWMEGVKHLFGFIMLGMALYFLDPILPDEIRWFMLPAFGVIAAAILLFADPTGNRVKGFRIVKTILCLVIAAVSIYALVPVEKKSPEWKSFSQSAYEASLTNNESMIVDFYADWCIPCKELDALTFSDPQVIEASQRYTSYKVDLTNSDSPETERLAKRFGIKGVPTLLIIDANGNEQQRITGFINAKEFLQKMK